MLFSDREDTKGKPDLALAAHSLSSLKDQSKTTALAKRIKEARPDNDYSALRALSRAQSSIRFGAFTKARQSTLTDIFT